ncbi:hypothetical protein MHM582_1010 [Microbacterium sp. HM58-2]|nr:hypothetical protein MHM582_1010 [Microbacterium sp. HM58-2]
MTDETRRLEFLVLGQTTDDASGWPHPVTISVHPRGERTLLNFSKGPPIANVGGQRSVAQIIIDGALDERFAEEFDACEARWLVPHLARLAAGEAVSRTALIEAYASRFGHDPKVEWSEDYTF